ncbi:hypothetical protein JANAI62_09980 [Jannaschia pagri]|uniref:Lipoprotein n=1 Tax=Jannaschia pagri TaxID=2829797 RepID=A0ABQ4NIX8_9RHOB|nr:MULTISPECIES: hypothetical protein [unclassified Jannaschia]GIT90543.1 hypothetical protein JANAI61_10010 [Jannaschia sp. AI_61]GIT94375.1 hypothetical protein JANAI62_09980 [Jannaschia sp. AI_62]
MRNTIKLVAVLGVAFTLVACGQQEEEVVFVPEVQPEPVSGKF